MIGTVVDENGAGVPDSDVRTFGVSSITDANGDFTITGVPTILGPIVVSAKGEIGGVVAFGQSRREAPVQGGVTDVGEIKIAIGTGFFSVDRRTIGVADSGVEEITHSLVANVADFVPDSVFEVAAVGDTNTLRTNGFEMGLLPNGDSSRPTNIAGLHLNDDGSYMFTVSRRSLGVLESGI